MLYPHMHRGIAVCTRGSPYAYRDFVNANMLMGNGTKATSQSPYAYSDWHGPHRHMATNDLQSWYAYGDWQGHRMHMGIVQSLTCLHMVIICIWGFGHQTPICKNLHMRISIDPRLHTGDLWL
jgi:hypothetical protein